MNIANNLLKHYLRNVYFFCGTACGGNQLYLDELYESGLFYIMRDDNSTVEKTLMLVEQHFGFSAEGVM